EGRPGYAPPAEAALGSRLLRGRQERGARRGQSVHAGRHPCADGGVRRHRRLRGGGLAGDPAGGGDGMNADDIIAALDLPAAARVDRRVPKTLLVEHGAPTAADRRQVNEGIEHIQWVAALKPTTIGVAAFRDDAREYLEIAVIRVALREDARTQ